jgi:uncharacterized protein (UPF0332 family)
VVVEESIFLTKAKKNIHSAQLLLDNRMFDDAANRAYYAVFHAALAALAAIGAQTERMSHEAAQSNFSSELIQKRKVYPGRFKSYLPELHAVRIDADYRLIVVSKKVATQQIKKAKEFVERVERELSK